ncbi:MAG TPA: glycogen-binding domain-containing protein [Candidatus Methylacidiphilales bacterium]|jgi:1,4-alpha-glucan branching enzyme|nr:glycogen-binding domain-containing protein [Candidatus Methylacidiphilales bacterium]
MKIKFSRVERSAGQRQFVTLLLVLTLTAQHLCADNSQNAGSLQPQKTDKGIVFKFSSPGSSAVYLAGDFNSWANNTNGAISDPSCKMAGPDAQGVWNIVVKLDPGTHAFKFCVNGDAKTWVTPDWAKDFDKDGNALIYVTKAGEPLLRNPVNSDWQPKQSSGSVTFSFYDPAAQSVYLAGDFNNWAENQNGLVTNSKYLMKKSDDGVWQATVTLPPGKHLYKFTINGGTWSPDPNGAGTDDQANSIIQVTK